MQASGSVKDHANTWLPRPGHDYWKHTACSDYCFKPSAYHLHVTKHTQQAEIQTIWYCSTALTLLLNYSVICCLTADPRVLTLIVEQSMLHYLSSRILWNTQAHWSVRRKLANALRRSYKYNSELMQLASHSSVILFSIINIL